MIEVIGFVGAYVHWQQSMRFEARVVARLKANPGSPAAADRLLVARPVAADRLFQNLYLALTRHESAECPGEGC